MKKGWEERTLAEVCEISSALVDPRQEDYENMIHVGAANIESNTGNLISLKSAKEENLISGKYCFNERAVLYSKIRPYLIKVARPGFAGLCSADIYPLVPREDRITRDFLYHALMTQHFTEFAVSGSARAGMPKVNREHLFSYRFAIPAIPEQQRIVSVLDEAFAGLATAQANAEKNLQNARALFESHLQSVFTFRGKGWKETTVGEIGKVSMCKRIFKEETTEAGDIPFYKIGTFGKAPDAFIPKQTFNEYRAKYPFPKKGDVLISASGTIGRRVRFDGEPAYFQDSNIVWIDNDEKQVLNNYLYHFYGACDWNSTKGATISRLYNENLRQIMVTFPESHDEQRRIVAQLDALANESQQLTGIYEKKKAAMEALKKSLLHQAFTGEL